MHVKCIRDFSTSPSVKPRASRTRRRVKGNSARSGSNTVSRPPVACHSGARLALGGSTATATHERFDFRWVCSWVPPMARLRAPRPLGRARQGSGQESAPDLQHMDRAVDRRGPQRPRRAEAVCAIGGVLSFGDFSLDKQRKVTCRGSTTHKFIYYIDKAPGGRNSNNIGRRAIYSFATASATRLTFNKCTRRLSARRTSNCKPSMTTRSPRRGSRANVVMTMPPIVSTSASLKWV
jgi:hypothetical protein